MISVTSLSASHQNKTSPNIPIISDAKSSYRTFTFFSVKSKKKKMSSRLSKKRSGKKNNEREELVRKSKIPEAQRRFTYLFEIYDHDHLGTISADDFPVFVRALGLSPTNAKMEDLAAACRENSGDDFFLNSRVEAVLTPIVIDVMLNPNHELAPPSDELLQLALKALDLEHKGHLTESDFRAIIGANAEKMDGEEIEDAIAEAVDPQTGVIDFKRYAGKMAYNSKLSYRPKGMAQGEELIEVMPMISVTPNQSSPGEFSTSIESSEVSDNLKSSEEIPLTPNQFQSSPAEKEEEKSEPFPSSTSPAEEFPSAHQTTEEFPSAQQPAEPFPSAHQTTEEFPSAHQTTEEFPSAQQPAEPFPSATIEAFPSASQQGEAFPHAPTSFPTMAQSGRLEGATVRFATNLMGEQPQQEGEVSEMMPSLAAQLTDTPPREPTPGETVNPRNNQFENITEPSQE